MLPLEEITFQKRCLTGCCWKVFDTSCHSVGVCSGYKSLEKRKIFGRCAQLRMSENRRRTKLTRDKLGMHSPKANCPKRYLGEGTVRERERESRGGAGGRWGGGGTNGSGCKLSLGRTVLQGDDLGSTLRASLSGTSFLQTLPDLVTPLEGLSLIHI